MSDRQKEILGDWQTVLSENLRARREDSSTELLDGLYFNILVAGIELQL